MQKADQNHNLEMDFAEFAQYMQEHETKLKLAFSHLDRNKDGRYIFACNCHLFLSRAICNQVHPVRPLLSLAGWRLPVVDRLVHLRAKALGSCGICEAVLWKIHTFGT